MSTSKKALLTYMFFSMESKLKMMLVFSVILNGIFALTGYFFGILYDFFRSVPMMMSIFLIIAGHGPRWGKWDKYASTLPVSTKEMVQSEYIWIFAVSILSTFMAFILLFSLVLSEKYEFEFDWMYSFLAILFYYSVLPKVHELEKYLEKGGSTSRFSYIEGFFLSITVHIAFFFATRLPLGFVASNEMTFGVLLVMTTLALTLESYKKSVKYAKNREF